MHTTGSLGLKLEKRALDYIHVTINLINLSFLFITLDVETKEEESRSKRKSASGQRTNGLVGFNSAQA